MKKCFECDSERIIKNAKTIDMAGFAHLAAAVDAQPDALVFKQRSESAVRAEICADCGYISIYAVNPQLLWTAYQSQKNDV